LKTGKAAIFVGANIPMELREYPVTSPQNGQALLKMRISGICGTDIHIMHGRLEMPSPLILGHELVGKIEEINGEGFEIGDNVIFNVATPCGKCLLCQQGDSANCLDFKVAFAQNPENEPHFFGGFAEYAYADIKNLIAIPKEVDYRAAAVFPCAGPTVIHALKLGGIFHTHAQHIDTAVVQGIGPVGLFAALWLKKSGVKNVVVLCRKITSERKNTLNEFGIDQLVDTKIASEYIAKLTNGIGADLAVECSGNPQAFLQGTEILRNRGLFLVPGQYSDSGNISFAPQSITFKALQIIGSSQYDMSDVSDYLDFLKKNHDMQEIIKYSLKTFSVSEINEALTYAESHAACKVALSGGE